MKNRTKILLTVIGVAIATTITANIASARYVGAFDLWVKGHETKRVGYLLKTKASRYVVNANYADTSRPKINLRSMILNSEGEWRSHAWGLTYEGTRNLHHNFASANYYYALEFTRQHPWDGWAHISGTWSPDTLPGEY